MKNRPRLTPADSIPLSKQAALAAEHALKTGSKTLYLWPLRKSPFAYTNVFQCHFLAALLGSNNGANWPVDWWRKQAEEAGFTLIEVNLMDYEAKATRDLIAQQINTTM